VLVVLLGMHDALGARVVLLTLRALRAALSCAPRALEAAPAALRTAELHAPHLLALLQTKPAAARRGAPARTEREARLLHAASAACVGLLCAAPACAELFSRLEADRLLLQLLPPPPLQEHSAAADALPPAATPLAVLRMVSKLQYRRLSQVAGATAPGSRSQAWTEEAAATEHEVAEALRLQALAALRQLLRGALLPVGRARAAVWQLAPQLRVPAATARAEAAMGLDALCEWRESSALDVCEAGGTVQLADAMAEVYHAQQTQDISRARQRSPTATYDMLCEACQSGNLL